MRSFRGKFASVSDYSERIAANIKPTTTKPISMKKPLIVTLVLATLALASSQLLAGPLLVNIRFTAEIQGAGVYVNGNSTNSASRTSLNEAGVYQFLANVVSNSSPPYTNGFLTKPPAFPADGFIVYDPDIAITNISNNIISSGSAILQGLFYVTNTSGFYFPLSGLDTNRDYYSFMELDAGDFYFSELGFDNGSFREVGSGHILANNSGSMTDTDNAVLVIHNNPYAFNATDNNKPLIDSNTALEIQGVLKLSINATTNSEKVVGTLTGTGSLETVADYYEGVITTAKVTFLPENPSHK